MCEFKIMKHNDSSQIGEEILVLSYGENNELFLKDVLGMGEKIDSALILDVNTLSQEAVILEHPLIKDFIGLMRGVANNTATSEHVATFQSALESLKKSL